MAKVSTPQLIGAEKWPSVALLLLLAYGSIPAIGQTPASLAETNVATTRASFFVVARPTPAFRSFTPVQTGGAFSLRFHGNGVNDIDRVKISIDGPERPVDVGTGSFTIEFWMKAGPQTSTTNCSASNDSWIPGNIVFDRDVVGSGDFGDYGISIMNGRLAFGVNNGATGATACGALSVVDNQWHHIATTRNSLTGELKIYVDGSSVGSVNGPTGNLSYRNGRPTSFPNSDPFLVIGAEKLDAGSAFPSYSGFIDEVRISDVIRYSGNFTQPTQEFTTDASTVGLYHFNEGSATTVNDSSGAAGGPSNGIIQFGGSPAGPEWSSDTPFPSPMCTYTLAPMSDQFGKSGGQGGVDVGAQPACSWAAASNAGWITITSGASETGNARVDYLVAINNTTNARTGTMTIAGQIFTVNQSAIPGVGISFFKSDFDSDGKTEIGFYRAGLWAWLKSSQSYSFGRGQFFSWGGADLQPICADFDGDGKADIGYMVPPSGGQSAAYAILKSTANYSFGQALFVPAGFPSLGDTPVVGDFDGDGKADPGIWRASQGVWIIPLSSSNYTSLFFAQWGQLGDFPVVADFDRDGKADLGFYRDGLWGVLKSTQSYSFGSAQFFSWGGAGQQPILGDFDGDSKADIAYMVPPAGGQSAAYAILKSGTGYDFGQAVFVSAGFPSLGDTPVVGDYDGDGKGDPGIWRQSQGVWIIALSSGSYASYIFTQWGQPGDIAFPNSSSR